MESRLCVDEDTRTSMCSDRLGTRSKMHYLAELIHKNKNTNIIVSIEKPEDVVH